MNEQENMLENGNFPENQSEELKKKILEESHSKRPETKIVDGELFHKRTTKSYEKIWNAFRDDLKDFEEKMGYGKEMIEKIGVNKFIDAMDWRSPSDVPKWKTDMMHIYFCVNCEDNFVIYEETPICKVCKEQYDFEKIEKAVESVNGYMVNMLFTMIPDFKVMFLKESDVSMDKILENLGRITDKVVQDMYDAYAGKVKEE